MSALNTNQTTVANSLSLSYYNDSKLSARDIREIVADIKRRGRIDACEVSMVYGSTYGLFESGEVIERDGYLVLVENTPALQLEAQEDINQEQTIAEPQADLIDQQIAEGQASQDPAYRLHAQMLSDCTKGDWLDQLVAEIEQEQQQPEDFTTLEIPEMKLKNSDRDDPYWLFTGSRLAAFSAVGWLKDLGISSTAKPNGSNGKYILIVPRWARGRLTPYAECRAA